MNIRLIFLLTLLFIVVAPRHYHYPTSNPTVQRFMDYIYHLSRMEKTELLEPLISKSFLFYFGWFKFNREDFVKFIDMYHIRRRGPYEVKDMGKIRVNETGEMVEYHGLKVVLNTTRYLAKFIVYKLDDQGHWLLASGNTIKTYHDN